MNPLAQTLLRALLKVGGGALVAKGITDESTLEVIIAGVLALAGVVWGIVQRKAGPATVPIKTASTLPLLALTAAIAFSATGCASLQQPDKVARFAAVAKVAAYDTTALCLLEKPDWRSGFELARADLATLEAANVVDFATLLEIVQRLPVKELKSPEARIAFSSAQLLLEEFTTGEIVNAQTLSDLRPVVSAIRSGIDRALAEFPP